jgi:hypothetical protein
VEGSSNCPLPPPTPGSSTPSAGRTSKLETLFAFFAAHLLPPPLLLLPEPLPLPLPLPLPPSRRSFREDDFDRDLDRDLDRDRDLLFLSRESRDLKS